MAHTWQAGRRIGLGLTLAAAVLALPAHAQEEKVLNIYNWSDYIGDDTIKNFEKETGIKVRYDVFDNNEILNAKLVAGKSGYDIVVPTAQWARLQIDAGLLRKLDKSKLTNLGNLDPNLPAKLSKIDPNNDYLVDWLWGYTTVGINVNKVKAALGAMPLPENAWDLVFDPKYAAKLKSCGVSFLDSPSEVLPAALMFDTMAIPADAPHPNNAHLFINYILRPQVHASLSNKVFYANPNPASIKYVRKDIGENKAIFLPDADKQRMAAPEATTADIRRLMTRIYTKFKTGL